ncbi:MAG: phosphoenolpyruvate--protein phosphotransferase [Candidatus Zixiibacteriota bacterium]|nr:MAG: phosphoenolpyruvate--protein phosphotransferase [candidate division Zixibacteria bacterium]
MKKTLKLKGVAACPGLTFGEARVVYSWEQAIEEREISELEVEEEYARLDGAVKETLVELEKFKESAGKLIGGPVAKIFESQWMIASDQEFLKNVKAEIKASRKSAEYVYSLLVEKAVAPLRFSKDRYMRQMVVDIEAVSNRILRRLTGQTIRHIGQAPQGCIFIGKIFSPAEVMNLFERKAKAIITTSGGVNSHMALIARSLLIPTVVGVPQAHLKISTGDRLIVDGDKGLVTVHPLQEEWNELRKKKARVTALQILKLDKLPYFPPITADNVDIDVAANIDLPGPVDQVLAEHRVGIGLYRTEFIYLQNGRFPPEEKQFRIYDSVAERYHPRPVVIRTFDLGSDKFYSTDNHVRENNPALGWRGIRASLDMPNIFRDQVRAILRASVRGNVKMLIPMIADISELRRALRAIKRAMMELKKRGNGFNEDIEVGVMIEVPSAALAADTLADKVSFFSVGSNDLTQYTLAADRDNQKLAKIYNPLHPGVLRLIRMTIDAARNHNIPVTMCGEMSGDVLTVPLLMGMGISQFSMNPSKLYDVCNLIPKIKYSDTVSIAENALRMKTLKEIENLLFEYNKSLR